MGMHLQEFKKNVMLYGADLNVWPDKLKEAALNAAASSADLRAFLAEHREFESALRDIAYEEPSADLVDRIIDVSNRKEKKSSRGWNLLPYVWLDELWWPRSSFILASTLMIAVLAIGFLIGFLNFPGPAPVDSAQSGLKNFFHHEEDTLWPVR